MSVVIEVAEAVKTELNEHEFSQAFTSERKYRAIKNLKDLKGLHVTVVPKTRDSEIEARNSCLESVAIDVAIQKKVFFETNEAPDALMALVEEIADFFRLRRLVAYPDAAWIEDENDPIFAPEHVKEFGVFTSVLTLTFQLVR